MNEKKERGEHRKGEMEARWKDKKTKWRKKERKKRSGKSISMNGNLFRHRGRKRRNKRGRIRHWPRPLFRFRPLEQRRGGFRFLPASTIFPQTLHLISTINHSHATSLSRKGTRSFSSDLSHQLWLYAFLKIFILRIIFLSNFIPIILSTVDGSWMPLYCLVCLNEE